MPTTSRGGRTTVITREQLPDDVLNKSKSFSQAQTKVQNARTTYSVALAEVGRSKTAFEIARKAGLAGFDLELKFKEAEAAVKELEICREIERRQREDADNAWVLYIQALKDTIARAMMSREEHAASKIPGRNGKESGGQQGGSGQANNSGGEQGSIRPNGSSGGNGNRPPNDNRPNISTDAEEKLSRARKDLFQKFFDALIHRLEDLNQELGRMANLLIDHVDREFRSRNQESNPTAEVKAEQTRLEGAIEECFVLIHRAQDLRVLILDMLDTVEHEGSRMDVDATTTQVTAIVTALREICQDLAGSQLLQSDDIDPLLVFSNMAEDPDLKLLSEGNLQEVVAALERLLKRVGGTDDN